MATRAHYTAQDKRMFVVLARHYNNAAIHSEEDPVRFVRVSLAIQSARARVPKRMRTQTFIESCGVE